MKNKRVSRPKDELKRELVEQLQLLRRACKTFDEGLEAAGKHIALSIRLLIHHQGQSRALLEQLAVRPSYFLDSGGPLDTRNLLTGHTLVCLELSTTTGRYRPRVSAGEPPMPMRQLRFADWWNNPVLKDDKGRTFSRRDLVLHVADTDGGAHVDPNLDEAYIAISRENSLGWQFTTENITKAMDGRPELACMRQIAHEILSTIYRFVPEFRSYSQPVIVDIKAH
jgi:hypothetical protein